MRNMFAYFLILCVVIGCAVSESIEDKGFRATNYAHASDPDPLPGWVLIELKKYPIETFLFVVGKSRGTGKEAFENALAEARNRIATRILWNVQAIVLANDSVQYNMVREHYSAVLEHYCREPQESPALQLGGLSEQNLSIRSVSTDQYTYALVYIRRDELKHLYTKQEQKLHREINRILEDARNAESALDIEGAMRIYLRTYPLYEALKEAEIIQIGAEYAPNFSESLARLESAATDISGDILAMSHRQVIKRVMELNSKPIVTFDDITDATISQLVTQWSNTVGAKVQLEPLTYKHDGLICQFSRDFSSSVKKRLEWNFVHRSRGFRQINFNHNRTSQEKLYRLSGSCWENGDEITIRKTLRDLQTGEFLASSVVSFLGSQLREPLVLTPPNYKQFRQNQEFFKPQYQYTTSNSTDTGVSTRKERLESQFTPIGGLEVEVWTDKGRDPVYYAEGERMTIFGRVNQPVYLRLLYILADRKYTLLQDNYYIDPAQINSDVEIGTFVCAPPFGAEILVVAARTEKFPPVQTYEKDDYVFLVDQNPELASREFRGEDEGRGMKPVLDEGRTGFQHNEAQVVVVTMEK